MIPGLLKLQAAAGRWVSYSGGVRNGFLVSLMPILSIGLKGELWLIYAAIFSISISLVLLGG